MTLDRSTSYLLNPGSVGQPRDGEPRLAYGIFDTDAWSMTVVREEYDVDGTARAVREAGIPCAIALRLLGRSPEPDPGAK